MNSMSKMSKWLRSRNRYSRCAWRKRNQRRLALERLDRREMLSVTTTVTDPNVFFQTEDQNMWASGEAASIHASFSETLIDVDFPNLSIGGYDKIWNPTGPDPKTGLKVKASGGFDLFVEVYCRDREHFVSFLSDSLQQVPGVERTETFMILKMYKLSYRWGEAEPAHVTNQPAAAR